MLLQGYKKITQLITMLKLINILILKAFREGEIIDVIFMIGLVVISISKDSFFPNLLIPLFFYNKMNYLIWSNKNEKIFYLQFDKCQLKSVVNIKQLFFLIEFNIVYVIISFFTGISIYNWIILNVFVIVNLCLSNILFKLFINKNHLLDISVKFVLFMIMNIFLLTAILLFEPNSYLELISFLFLLLIFFLRFYTLKLLFKNFNKIYL